MVKKTRNYGKNRRSWTTVLCTVRASFTLFETLHVLLLWLYGRAKSRIHLPELIVIYIIK